MVGVRDIEGIKLNKGEWRERGYVSSDRKGMYEVSGSDRSKDQKIRRSEDQKVKRM